MPFKHDLLAPNLDEATILLRGEFGFPTTEALFQALFAQSSHGKHQAKTLCQVLSHSDAPRKPLARELKVIGFVDKCLPIVTELAGLGGAARTEQCFHRCTIDVRHHKPTDFPNARNFAKLMRRMQKEGAVAIIGCDKLERFGILVPSTVTTLEGNFEDPDYRAKCYIGEVNAVRAVYLPQQAAYPLSQEPREYESDVDKKISPLHKHPSAIAAESWYIEVVRTQETRPDSLLYHMRNFNNWVKATLIAEIGTDTNHEVAYQKQGPPLRVLDLCCGKGGDLKKWLYHRRGISNYVGVDAALTSLRAAAKRARKLRGQLNNCTFTCADLGADVLGRLKSPKHRHMQNLLTWSLQKERQNVTGNERFEQIEGGGISIDDKFDVASVQMAIHYFMETKERARRFFHTVSELLEHNGSLLITTIDSRVVVEYLMGLGLNLNFDNNNILQEDVVISVGEGACHLCFKPETVRKLFIAPADSLKNEDFYGLEYFFSLKEGSEQEAGFGFAVNLPEWLAPIPALEALGNEAGLEMEFHQNFHEFLKTCKDEKAHPETHAKLRKMKVLNQNGTISDDEFEIIRLYCAIKFRKVKESTMQFDDEDEA